MIEFSAIIVGETRTWNSRANDDWLRIKELLRRENVDLKVYGCTWDYCAYPEDSSCFEKVVVLDFENNEFRKSDLSKFLKEYTKYMLEPQGIPYENDNVFFWNWIAQHCQWAYMLTFLNNHTNTELVFKHRWDESVRDNRHGTVVENLLRSYDRMKGSPSIDVVDLNVYTNDYENHISLRDRIKFNDIMWCVNKEWMVESIGTNTAVEFLYDRFVNEGRMDVDHHLFLKAPKNLKIHSYINEDCWEKIGGYTSELNEFTSLGDVGKNVKNAKRLKT
jgi:hypothetical protein